MSVFRKFDDSDRHNVAVYNEEGTPVHGEFLLNEDGIPQFFTKYQLYNEMQGKGRYFSGSGYMVYENSEELADA